MFYRRNAPGDAVILDFSPELENHCRVYRRNAPGDVVILDLRPRLGNHSRFFTRNALQRAAILDLRGGSIWESLQGLPQKSPRRCSDS